MKILFKILFSIIVLVGIVLLVGLFVNGKVSVEREVTINRPVEEVFDYVKYLKNQDHFSKWARMDPEMKKKYQGTDGAVGFISAWESENKDVGMGEQEILKIEEGKRIDFELRFYKPYKSTDNAYIITERINSNITKVKWGFEAEMKYPMNLMLLVWNMEEDLGNDLQEGLNRLKELQEM
ncbi:SRPBCC family protein [Xanthovirga aplysinae]|uniref:SRPBCC family protein n=1 Tax=Xanthovirga aplysinae TaxID=2529853 RepID=UPI0012BC6F50|nr:SRPBCC family protein [Xanthovirga aplysinae]MTI29724.1 polyketide cyclase [Xanthovirga aplysinae]